nr:DUF1629 domain-containing protein [Xanthomonas cucurbitae]
MESNRQSCGIQFTNERQLLSSPRLIPRQEGGGFPPFAKHHC